MADPPLRFRPMELDDLGLPTESDPHAFAQAFLAIRRQYDLRLVASENESPTPDSDDLGLLAESDPCDFASAFAAIRGQSALARFRQG